MNLANVFFLAQLENSTRGSQGPREAGSGSLNCSRRSGERSPGSGSSFSSSPNANANRSNGSTVPNINVNGQPTTTPTQDPALAPGLPNEEHHGTDSRGHGDNPSSGTSISGGGSQSHGGSWGRSTGTSVGTSVGEGGLTARVAVMVRGRLRGGDASGRARRRAAAADEKEDVQTDGKGNGVKGRIAGYFQRRKLAKSTQNRGGSPFKRPGRLLTLRLRVSLFVSKVRDGGSDAMGWLGVLIVDFLGRLSDLGDRVGRKVRGLGGRKDKKKKKKVRFSRWTRERVI